MNTRQVHAVKELMSAIATTLTSASARYEGRHGELPRGACQVEKVDRRTAMDELMEKEDREGIREPSTLPLFAGVGDGRPTLFDELAEQERQAAADSKEAALAAMEAHFWLLDFLFADGPHPGKVMRRLYAWVKKYRPEAIWDMGYRELGKLFDETGAAMEWRVGEMIDEYAKSHGVTGVKMPWQRTAEACGNYSAVQNGNANRVGGKRAAKTKTKQPL